MEKNEAAVLYHLHECEVDQGDLGSGKAKPTTLGTNLELTLPDMVDDLEKMDLTLTPGSL